jgi:hypothetical protein
MSPDALTVVTRSRQAGIVVIIAALFVVPPIVRATFPIGASTPIRLNRGFETPPAKAGVLTTLEQAAVLVSLGVPRERSATVRHPHLVVAAIVHQADRAPDLERGPPAIHI